MNSKRLLIFRNLTHFYLSISLCVGFCTIYSTAYGQGDEKKVQKPTDESTTSEFKPIDEENLFKNIDYPELQVVPRASDRLIMEAPIEKDQKASFFWTLQTPAYATLLTGLFTYQRYDGDNLTDKEKKDHDLMSMTAVGVGASWLLLDYYLMNAEPYNEALSKLSKIKKTDRKSELLRERIAEETLEKTARTMRILNTASIVTNLLGVTACINNTRGDIRNAMILPFAISFIPYIFSQRYVDVYDKHIEYKRKIYAPISKFDLQYDKSTGTFVPVYGLTWNF